jgi:hypothetical protein
MPTLIHKAMEVVHDRDPASVIREELAPYLDGFYVGGSDVLVAVYERSGAKTKVGGLFLPERRQDDDRIEGISGLVLKMGRWSQYRKTQRGLLREGHPSTAEDRRRCSVKVALPHARATNLSTVVDQYVRGIISRPDVVE